MSVILSSGKAAAAKLREGGKPKKMARPRTALPIDSYLPTDQTAVWNTRVDTVYYSIAFSKDSLDVWVNDQMMATVNDFNDTGSTVDFELGSKKARIAISPGAKGTKYELSLDGCPVEPAKPPGQKKHKPKPKQNPQQQQQQEQLSASSNGGGFNYSQLT